MYVSSSLLWCRLGIAVALCPGEFACYYCIHHLKVFPNISNSTFSKFYRTKQWKTFQLYIVTKTFCTIGKFYQTKHENILWAKHDCHTTLKKIKGQCQSHCVVSPDIEHVKRKDVYPVIPYICALRPNLNRYFTGIKTLSIYQSWRSFHGTNRNGFCYKEHVISVNCHYIRVL